MSHNVTYSPGDPARNRIRIRISCVRLEQKPSTGPEQTYIKLYDYNQNKNNYGQ